MNTNRYDVSFIDKPYVVCVHDCPGLYAIITKLKLISKDDFECLGISEYTDEFRFTTQELSQQFITIIEKYLNNEYDKEMGWE